jgi:hypothetical protein
LDEKEINKMENHIHTEEEKSEIGYTETHLAWVVEFWNNNQKYYGEACVFDIEDCEAIYNKKLQQYDNVLLKERTTHYVVIRNCGLVIG